MPEIDVQAMRRIAQKSHEREIEDRFGSAGIESLRDLLEFLIAFYQVHDADQIAGSIVVVKRLPTSPQTVITSNVSSGASFQTTDLRQAPIDQKPVTVVDVMQGAVEIWNAERFDHLGASDGAVVYRYESLREWFIVGRTEFELDKPSATAASNFSRPRFSSLRAALVDYGHRLVRTSACFILRDIWFDSKRLFLRTKPEKVMRRSLHQHLRAVLPDAVTRPEQIVDESHPVDLRVEWDLSAQEAIIEIKWMGFSRTKSRITVRHGEPRANKGAKQLADYLVASRQSAPTRQTRAYLVVIDARRQGLTISTTALSTADATHFRDREVTFDPEYHKTVEGFESPLRLFAEPA